MERGQLWLPDYNALTLLSADACSALAFGKSGRVENGTTQPAEPADKEKGSWPLGNLEAGRDCSGLNVRCLPSTWCKSQRAQPSVLANVAAGKAELQLPAQGAAAAAAATLIQLGAGVEAVALGNEPRREVDALLGDEMCRLGLHAL